MNYEIGEVYILKSDYDHLSQEHVVRNDLVVLADINGDETIFTLTQFSSTKVNPALHCYRAEIVLAPCTIINDLVKL